MKKRLYILMCMLIITSYLSVGKTYALFTDSICFNNNTLTTSQVNVSSELYNTDDLDSPLEKIEISNIYSEKIMKFTLVVENNSSIDIAYRILLDCECNEEILKYIDITIEDNNVLNNVSFKGLRGQTPWVRDKSSNDFSLNVTIKINSIPTELQTTTLGFYINLDATDNN